MLKLLKTPFGEPCIWGQTVVTEEALGSPAGRVQAEARTTSVPSGQDGGGHRALFREEDFTPPTPSIGRQGPQPEARRCKSRWAAGQGRHGCSEGVP